MAKDKIEVGQTITPGAFYWSRQPGGWADASTGIHFPGPIVKIDKVTRQITGVDSMPAPVQLPTHKESFSLTNPKEREVCAFDRTDSEALCEGLNLAMQTCNIEVCPNEIVQELYPKAWAKRQDRIVFKRGTSMNPTKPLAELVSDFMQGRRVRLKAGEATDTQDAKYDEQREKDRQKRIQDELQQTNPSLVSANQVSADVNGVSQEPAKQAPTPPTPPVPPTPPGA